MRGAVLFFTFTACAVAAAPPGSASLSFKPSNCTVTAPNTQITCQTAPGAGATLSWTVSVDEQDSVVAFTDYAPPSVEALEGPGARDADDVVEIALREIGRDLQQHGLAAMAFRGPVARVEHAGEQRGRIRDGQQGADSRRGK